VQLPECARLRQFCWLALLKIGAPPVSRSRSTGEHEIGDMLDRSAHRLRGWAARSKAKTASQRRASSS